MLASFYLPNLKPLKAATKSPLIELAKTFWAALFLVWPQETQAHLSLIASYYFSYCRMDDEKNSSVLTIFKKKPYT